MSIKYINWSQQDNYERTFGTFRCEEIFDDFLVKRTNKIFIYPQDTHKKTNVHKHFITTASWFLTESLASYHEYNFSIASFENLLFWIIFLVVNDIRDSRHERQTSESYMQQNNDRNFIATLKTIGM